MAAVNHKLMLALGYHKYVAQGGDWGSMIVRIMGIDYPESCLGVHVNMLAATPPKMWRNPLGAAYLIPWVMMQGAGSMFKRMMWYMKNEKGWFISCGL